MVKEPSVSAMLSRLNANVRLVCLRQKEDDRIVDPLIADLKIKRSYARKFGNIAAHFFYSRLFFQLTKRHVDACARRA